MFFFNSKEDSAREILSAYGLPLGDDSCWWVRYPKRAAEEIYKLYENTNGVITSCIGRELTFEEVITNNFGNQFHLRIVTGSRFPFKMSKAFVLEPKISSGTPHLYGDGSLCLMHANSYNSGMSLLDIRNQAVAWCLCYDIYRETGVWHAAEHEH